MSSAVPGAGVVITGATGWLGRAATARVARMLGPDWRRSVELFASQEREVRAPDGTQVLVRSLDDLQARDVEGRSVLHFAALTREHADRLGEQRFADANRGIDDTVLRAVASGKPAGVFVASSGAAARARSGEDDHPYGRGKLLQEGRFLEQSSHTPVLVGRIYAVAGPWVTKPTGFALTSFLVQARATGRVTVQASTPVFRSYLHVHDVCDTALSALALQISPPEPVDLCGAEVLEVGEVARAAAAAVGGAAVERGQVDWTRPQSYLGDATATKVLAMRCGVELASFTRQLHDTDRYLAATAQGAPGPLRAPSAAQHPALVDA